jgi:hypothetical protein
MLASFELREPRGTKVPLRRGSPAPTATVAPQTAKPEESGEKSARQGHPARG